MWLIRAALRRPISVIVIVTALALTAILALQRTRVDIFPDLNLPVIYVAQPYGGMSPQQMEGFVAYYYEYHFLYINGIENVEARSIQGASLLRLTFHPGTNMSEALAQTISYVNRARAFMPPGTVSPFVIRYDAGTLPVGYLVFNSPSRTLGEIQDLALNRVRPVFATLPEFRRHLPSAAISARLSSAWSPTSCTPTACRRRTSCGRCCRATVSSRPGRRISAASRPW